MLLSVHAIWGSASTPTAEHQRRHNDWRVIARASRTASSSLRWQSRIQRSSMQKPALMS